MLQQPQLEADASWKQRFRRVTTRTQIAKANPQRGLAASNRTGVSQLYAWDVATGELRQLTDRAGGVPGGVIAPDARWIFYLDDQQGNEIGHWVRVPFAGGPPEDITPELPPYASWGLSLNRTSSVIGVSVANDNGFQLYALPVEADDTIGEPQALFQTNKLMLGPALSYDGSVAVVAVPQGTGGLHFKLVALDLRSGAHLAELSDGADTSVEMKMFAPLPDDMRILGTSNRSGNSRPLLWNPRTGERADLLLPGVEGEVQPEDWSADGQHILLCQYRQAVQQLYLYNVLDNTAQKLEHPRGVFEGVSFGPDGQIFAHWQDATHPPQLIALDAQTGKLLRTVLISGEVPPSRPWRSMTFPSTDGTPIQGWLALPEGDGPFPTILDTHGGPTAVMMEYYSAGAQAWLDHGYAFATINYRGSTTFGREFEQQIWGDVGHWEVEDMVAAQRWLVDQGISAPHQILLTGWSYGGYLTLQALGKRPELWAGGLAGIAIADWAIQYEDSAETLKGYLLALLGGTPDEKPEVYAAASPITYVERVQAPVLVIQGSND
ncbi:MAG: S9 family peptidase, partial [Chloroflexi bacterium]